MEDILPAIFVSTLESNLNVRGYRGGCISGFSHSSVLELHSSLNVLASRNPRLLFPYYVLQYKWSTAHIDFRDRSRITKCIKLSAVRIGNFYLQTTICLEFERISYRLACLAEKWLYYQLLCLTLAKWLGKYHCTSSEICILIRPWKIWNLCSSRDHHTLRRFRRLTPFILDFVSSFCIGWEGCTLLHEFQFIFIFDETRRASCLFRICVPISSQVRWGSCVPGTSLPQASIFCAHCICSNLNFNFVGVLSISRKFLSY